MKICVVGGGPSGLYFSICIKRRMPDAEVIVFDRTPPDMTFGWGVVFSKRTQETLLANDRKSAICLSKEFVHWDAIETTLELDSLVTDGYPFVGIDRRILLQILANRCLDLGVDIAYGRDVLHGDQLVNYYDLVVAADGVNSRFRAELSSDLGVKERFGSNKYIWLGTKAVFDRFRFIFKKPGRDWIWAHAYPFDRETSTFIVECGKRAWREYGFCEFDSSTVCQRLAALFEDVLEGEELLTNSVRENGSHWEHFRQVDCRRWSTGNVVLIGDAAHTIHFSVGSGTKQAFDDAVCLANSLANVDDIQVAIANYQTRRITELANLKAKGSCSMRWFEDASAYADNLGIGDFERALLNRADYEKAVTARSWPAA